MLESAMQWFFPMRCVGCRQYDSRGFCPQCAKSISKNPFFFRAPFLQAGISLGPYAWPLREMVWEFKFKQRRGLAKILGQIISDRIRRLAWKLDLVSFVPLTHHRIRERGFNQAKALAVRVGNFLHLPCLDLLRFTRFIQHQVGLGRKARLQNVKGTLSLLRSEVVTDKTILLVDDVITSGATLSECAVTLKNNGAGSIYAACIAHQKSDYPEENL